MPLLAVITLHSPQAMSQAISIGIYPRPINRELTIDSLRYIITYDATTIRDLDRPDEVDHDVVNLEIGKVTNKLYSVPLHETEVEADKRREMGQPVMMHPSYAQLEDLYIMNSKGVVRAFVRDVAGGPSLYYEETIPKIDWTQRPGTREILGYNCLCATCDFRGRHYTAWFAPDLPLPYGPWKFGGLPGLILDLSDDTGAISFSALSIHRAKPGTELIQWVVGARKVTREQAAKAVRNMFAHPVENMRMVTGGAALFNDEGEVSESAYYPYNPIELE